MTLAIAICIPFLIPFLTLIFTAVRTEDDFRSSPGGFPQSFTLENIINAWVTADLGRALVSTLVVAVVASLVAVSVGVAGAFWFRIHSGRLARALKALLIIGYTVPAVAWLLPVFVSLSSSGLTDNVVVAGIVIGVSSVPFAIYLIGTFYHQVLTDELMEASSLDGAGTLRKLWSIGVPMARPAVAAVLALVFVWAFGDLIVSATLLQGDPAAYTLTLAATNLSTREEVDLQGQAAVALVSLLPVLAVFAVAQKSLAAGFGEGSDR
jgi:ABC-type glycerol-3-phosphate transport system permease component